MQKTKAWLCERIATILDRIDGEGRQPLVLEAEALARAMDHIARGRFQLANGTLDELRRRATALRWNAVASPVRGGAMTTAALRAKLNRVAS